MFCSRCGLSINSTSPFCTACGQATGILPLARAANSPSAYTTPLPATLNSVAYAGFWLRLVAWTIDQALVGSMALIMLSRLVSLMSELNRFRGMEPLDNPEDVYAVLGLGATVGFVFSFVVMSWLYHAVMESSAWQGTVGKRALRIVVTDLAGGRLDFGKASGRYFSRYVTNLIPFGIGYAFAGFTRRKQAVHDLISNCLVLRRL